MFTENFHHGIPAYSFPQLHAGSLDFQKHLRQNGNDLFAERSPVELGQTLDVFQRKIPVINRDGKFDELIHAESRLKLLKEEVNKLRAILPGRKRGLEHGFHFAAHTGEHLPHGVPGAFHLKQSADGSVFCGIDSRSRFFGRPRWRLGRFRLCRGALSGSSCTLLRNRREWRGREEEENRGDFHERSLCVIVAIAWAVCRTVSRRPALCTFADGSARRSQYQAPTWRAGHKRAQYFCKASARANRW